MTRLPPRAEQDLLRRLLSAAPDTPARRRGGTKEENTRKTPRTREKPAQRATAPTGRESPGEAALAAALRLHGADLPPPVRELVFYPGRRWRFDFCWPDALVACEVDGGQFAHGGGRHATDADRDKLNHAAALGYRVLRFSPQQIAADPAGCVALIRRALEARP